MAVKLCFNRVEQFCDGNGLPYSGGKLFTYAAGSSTKLTTYTENTGSVANTNPIVLDSSGRLPQPLWLTVGSMYKFVLAPSTDTDPPTSPIWTLDNISGINDASVTLDQWVSSGLTPTFVSTVSFTLAGDQTTAFHIGRRLKTTNTAGTVYSTITNAVFGALTTVTVVNDSGVLDAGLSAVSYGLITDVNHSIPSLQAKGDILTQAVAGTVTRIAAGTDFYTLMAQAAGTNGIQWADGSSAAISMVNGSLVPSRTGNAETIAVKTRAGNDPSVTDPVIFIFRGQTAGSASYSPVAVTAALSLTISSGSTLGASNAVPFRVWVIAMNDASTVRLGAVNCLSGTSVLALRDDIKVTATAEGGGGGATSAQVIYANATVGTARAMRILGYFEYTLATAGTWNTAQTKGHIFSPNTPTPGQLVQVAMNQTGAVATGTTAIPADDTIPQITEGDQYMTQAITPTSAANLLEIEAVIARFSTSSGGTNNMGCALFQDATANALAATAADASATAISISLPPIKHKMVAGTASSTTFKVRAGGSVGATTTFNGGAGARVYGGVLASSIYVREFMA